MSLKTLTIATRESPLALWQANYVKQTLEVSHPGLTVRLLGLTTTADHLLDLPLYKVGGKGLFVKELETALLTKKADIAVHSMKDVPMDLPDGLMLAAMMTRENPFDVFVSTKYLSIDQAPENVKIGTSSLRRQSQLLARYPHLNIEFLRGNVNTRLAKLDRGDFVGIILAAAGLKRLGFEERIRHVFSATDMLPAAGQGVLGIECRVDDAATQSMIQPLNDAMTHACVLAERAVCRVLDAGCHAPVAAFAERIEKTLYLRARVLSCDGKMILSAEGKSTVQQAEPLGVSIAQDLLSQGAKKILDIAEIKKNIK